MASSAPVSPTAPIRGRPASCGRFAFLTSPASEAPMNQPQSNGPRTLFEKIWQTHAVVEREDGQTLLYIDRHLVHDGSARAFEVLAERGLKMARPDRTFAVPDHYVPPTGTRTADGIADDDARRLAKPLTRNAPTHAFTLFDL